MITRASRGSECTQSTCTFMAHRQTECHGEGPRGTIVHDEHHVLQALSQTEKGTTTYTYSSNKCTFSLSTAQTLTHTNTHTLHMQQRLTLLMSIEFTSHSIQSIAIMFISYTKYFPPLSLFHLLLLFPIPPATFRWALHPKIPTSIIIQMYPMSVLFLVLQSLNK